MAADTLSDGRGAGPEPLSAVRQQVRSLPAREREALLRVLLEQYENRGPLPVVDEELALRPASLAPPTPPPDSALHGLSLAERPFSQSPTLIASPRSGGFAPPPPPQPLHALLRSKSLSQSLSPSAQALSRPSLRQHHHPRLPASPHRRSHSLSTVEMPSPTIFAAGAFSPPPPYSYGSVAALPAPSAAPVDTSTRAYWCTLCGKKYQRRSDWTRHDEECRGQGREQGRGRDRSRDTSKSRSRSHDHHDHHHHHSHSHSTGSRSSSSRTRRTRPRQRAWACGFCAAFLGSVDRYHDHVALHFESGKTLAHWHYAHVIYGLLHQPAVHEAWKRLWSDRTAALPSYMRPKVSWPPETHESASASASSDVDGSTSEPTLQDALESFQPGRQSADVLAMRADALAVFVAVPIEDAESAADGPLLKRPGKGVSAMNKSSTRKAPPAFPHRRAVSAATAADSASAFQAGYPTEILAEYESASESESQSQPPPPTNFARPLPSRHVGSPSSNTGLLPPPWLSRGPGDGGRFPPSIPEETDVSSDLSHHSLA